jgi:N-acyl-D-amino-acid deacylase
MPNILVRGGTVVDGDGGPPRLADVRIVNGIITEVSSNITPNAADQVFDASGYLVTPGFVDVHTHYDGQATWDEQLAPSCWHGVTTVVMGNCGVGFAPVHPGQHQRLIDLMEGVEDIPGTALTEGIPWGWETFPEYLDKLESRRWMVDVGTHVPHSAVRHYVMGERAATGNATDVEIGQICAIVREGIEAGALGVSASRLLAHRDNTGGVVPGTYTEEAEFEAIAEEMARLGRGVFELIPRGMDGEVSEIAHAEIDWIGNIATKTGRPVVFGVMQTHTELDRWKMLLDHAAELQAKGIPVYPQVGARPAGIVFGLQSVQNTFSTRPSYKAIQHLPFAERVAEMRKPEVRARILSEPNGTYRHPMAQMLHEDFSHIYPIQPPIELEPTKENTVIARAAANGVTPEEFCYDHMLGNDGRNLLQYPITNYYNYSLQDVHDMLLHPSSHFGLGDGGAHCGVACDAGTPTMMLSFWARDRTRGPKIDIGRAVRMISRDTAELYGLHDRGRIAPGYRADINVVDHARLQLLLPEMVFDLPTGARRLMQRAVGYVATYVAGERTIDNDNATGALPGRLIRGPQSAQNAERRDTVMA